jgi:hypothetical protein
MAGSRGGSIRAQVCVEDAEVGVARGVGADERRVDVPNPAAGEVRIGGADDEPAGDARVANAELERHLAAVAVSADDRTH